MPFSIRQLYQGAFRRAGTEIIERLIRYKIRQRSTETLSEIAGPLPQSPQQMPDALTGYQDITSESSFASNIEAPI